MIATDVLRMLATSVAGLGFGLMIGSAFGAANSSEAISRVGLALLLLAIYLVLRSQSNA